MQAKAERAQQELEQMKAKSEAAEKELQDLMEEDWQDWLAWKQAQRDTFARRYNEFMKAP